MAWASTASACCVSTRSWRPCRRWLSSRRCWPDGWARARSGWDRSSASAIGVRATSTCCGPKARGAGFPPARSSRCTWTADACRARASARRWSPATSTRPRPRSASPTRWRGGGRAAGDRAARLLGKPYAVSGRVVRGRQLGRTLGYPTANLRFGGKVPALRGIYATRVHGIEAGVAWPSVSSFGTRPTVGGVEPLLEAHLFDFDGDLYGRRIEVEFVARLRDEEKFPDLPT